MHAPEPTPRLVIELDPAPGPIRGRIHSDVAPVRPFTGWTELGTAIEQLRSHLAQEAGNAAGATVATCRASALGG